MYPPELTCPECGDKLECFGPLGFYFCRNKTCGYKFQGTPELASWQPGEPLPSVAVADASGTAPPATALAASGTPSGPRPLVTPAAQVVAPSGDKRPEPPKKNPRAAASGTKV